MKDIAVTVMNEAGFCSKAEERNNETRYIATKEHLFSEMQGDAVILSLKNGKYYGLNSVGVSIWQALQQSVSFAEIKLALMNEYAVDEPTCEREIGAFLAKMAGEGLIEEITV